MNMIQRAMAAIKSRHWAHQGEVLAHVTYLSATFIEGHGFHAMAAGGVVFFILASMAMVQHAIE